MNLKFQHRSRFPLPPKIKMDDIYFVLRACVLHVLFLQQGYWLGFQVVSIDSIRGDFDLSKNRTFDRAFDSFLQY